MVSQSPELACCLRLHSKHRYGANHECERPASPHDLVPSFRLDESVNRLDYAVDIATGNFDLHMENFIAPRRASIGCYFVKDLDLDDEGDTIKKSGASDLSAVMRGRRFESVTIGTMPNR